MYPTERRGRLEIINIDMHSAILEKLSLSAIYALFRIPSLLILNIKLRDNC
jgi:hypothetical protein